MDFCTCKNGNVPAAPVLAMVQAPVQPWETLYDPEKALREGKRVMFEAQLGALREPLYAAEKGGGLHG